MVSVMHFDSKTMPASINDYSCHIKAVELVWPCNHMRSISYHYLLIALGADTQMHAHTSILTYQTKAVKKPVGAHQLSAGMRLI